jgi:hypothetical protein
MTTELPDVGKFQTSAPPIQPAESVGQFRQWLSAFADVLPEGPALGLAFQPLGAGITWRAAGLAGLHLPILGGVILPANLNPDAEVVEAQLSSTRLADSQLSQQLTGVFLRWQAATTLPPYPRLNALVALFNLSPGQVLTPVIKSRYSRVRSINGGELPRIPVPFLYSMFCECFLDRLPGFLIRQSGDPRTQFVLLVHCFNLGVRLLTTRSQDFSDFTHATFLLMSWLLRFKQ